jgi:RimJ/RimL family protein N-acetyltransferase
MRLETEKLTLREFTLNDLDAFAWLMADPEVMRFSLSGPMNRELASEYLQKRILDHYVKYGYGLYAVVQKADNCLIGFVGLIGQNIDGESKVELGYRLHPKYWGKGLATEACLAVCQYAFTQLGMDELISIIDPKNTRSLEVAKRVGMKYLKEASFHHIPVQIYMIKAPESCQKLVIRNLQVEDLNKLANTFTFPWSSFEATLKLWEQWFKEHQEGIRTVCVLERQNRFLGYGSLLRVSEYPFFREKGIPEVNAIWIDEPFRKQGLGKKLIEHLESMARQEGYKTIGIGVGLYKDYGPAQRLYYKMGYQPDGNGISYKGHWVVPGAQHPIDDDLLLWFTKSLATSKPSFHFKHVDATERSLVHHWLLQPHVAQWFYGQGLENTFKHLDEFLAGSSSAQYWLAFDKGHPFAFLITSHVDKPHDELAKWCNSDGQAMTLDMLIGDPSYLGKGYAVQVIHQFLLSQFSNVNEVLIDPEATNAKAIHVYQKAGFNKLDEFIPSHSPHPHYMMKLNLQELRKQQGKLGDSKSVVA